MRGHKGAAAFLAVGAWLCVAQAFSQEYGVADETHKALANIARTTKTLKTVHERPRPPNGAFDYYTLALEWLPAFCDSKTGPEKDECTTQTPERYDSRNLSLHGLWPTRKRSSRDEDYYECSVPDRVRELDTCEKPLKLSAETQKNLTVYMPSAESCLDHHEWYKHGICSGMSADVYFARAIALVAQVAKSNLGKFLSANVGNTVALDRLFAEFKKDSGEGRESSVNFFCKQKRGGHLLLEVRMYLKNPLPEGELKEMLTQPDDPFVSGNCPATFLIDPSPSTLINKSL